MTQDNQTPESVIGTAWMDWCFADGGGTCAEFGAWMLEALKDANLEVRPIPPNDSTAAPTERQEAGKVIIDLCTALESVVDVEGIASEPEAADSVKRAWRNGCRWMAGADPEAQGQEGKGTDGADTSGCDHEAEVYTMYDDGRLGQLRCVECESPMEAVHSGEYKAMRLALRHAEKIQAPGEGAQGIPQGAADHYDPGHRLTEAELDAAVKTYHDTRSRFAKSTASVRNALEAVIRGYLAAAPVVTASPKGLEALKDALDAMDRADLEIARLCKEIWATGKGWRWSIPADPRRDTDLILSDAITKARALLAPAQPKEADTVPTALTWTKEKPTVEGWYWYRWKLSGGEPIHMIRDKSGLHHDANGDRGMNVEEMNGLWCPIAPPGEAPRREGGGTV
jgi:hypothetical protein